MRWFVPRRWSLTHLAQNDFPSCSFSCLAEKLQGCDTKCNFAWSWFWRGLKNKQVLKETEAESLNPGCFCKYSWTLGLPLQMVLITLKTTITKDTLAIASAQTKISYKTKWQTSPTLVQKKKKNPERQLQKAMQLWGTFNALKEETKSFTFSFFTSDNINFLPTTKKKAIWVQWLLEGGAGTGGEDLCHLKTGPQTGVSSRGARGWGALRVHVRLSFP